MCEQWYALPAAMSITQVETMQFELVCPSLLLSNFGHVNVSMACIACDSRCNLPREARSCITMAPPAHVLTNALSIGSSFGHSEPAQIRTRCRYII